MNASEAEPCLRLLTPPGRGGLQVLGVEGAERHTWVARLLRWPDGREVSAERLEGRAGVRLDLWLPSSVGGESELVDEAVFVDVPAERRSELHLHGAPAILDVIERTVGLRRGGGAGGGASVGRYEDLLRRARCDAQLAVALEQLEFGAAGFDRLRREFDASDGAERAAWIERLVRARRVLSVLLEPPRLALIGRQNAGKSTLFNRLLFADRNLTGARPGLTRDAVVEPVDFGGYPFELVDTAGLGEEVDSVDALAQARSRAEIERAEVLLVVPRNEGFSTYEDAVVGEALLVIESKADRPRAGRWPDGLETVQLLALESGRALEVREALGAALLRRLGLPPAPRRGLGVPLPRDDADDRWIAAVGSE